MHVGVLGLTSHSIVIVLNRCVIDQTRDRDVFLCTSRMRIDPHLTRWTRLVAQGRIRPVITRVCQLEEADEVLRSIERMELAGRACAMLP